ncbi:hypothetical protein A2382_03870 [Candidatus Woesebacteria bacterium RIFOXYB1_FULL_38_16]|uniref:Uncharacterized protein n=1 Tax=Candidatus Woesebacteria bacterium RIFOXYB1_FULL_38_16 TaxID=1802538 RepID=A0A1F8CWR5_9BACT|nr:MAG: hypothetical protein A2191_03575 [Candidatus Woesebacteria bacterium RIFOXYA1_FULL_38_9]OGM80249.1 MAG: hypothetical protein A2382_03870 [Candidatus Woesebacteria bacterium RIFOXYB1_FULL_38_16]
MSDESFSIIQENDPNQEGVQVAKEHITEEFAKFKNILTERLSPIDNETAQIVDDIKIWLKERLVGRFGIPEESLHWPEAIFFANEEQIRSVEQHTDQTFLRGADGSRVNGTCIPGVGIIINEDFVKSFKDEDLCKYALTNTLLEEIWHSTAEPRFTVLGLDTGRLRIYRERTGMGFMRYDSRETEKSDPVWNKAIEEGMARFVMNDAGDLFHQITPEGWKKYLEIIKEGDYSLYHRPELSIDSNGEIAVVVGYPGAFDLIVELNKALNNRGMYHLEKARLSGNFLELARLLQKAYGKSVFRQVMATTLEDAANKAEELNHLRWQKNKK